MNTTHSSEEFRPDRIPFLGPFGPLFLAAAAGEHRGQLYTDPQVARPVFMGVFERCVPLCCLGLMQMDDATLTRWLWVLGYEQLTGEGDMLPSWAFVDDQPLTGITALLRMPLWERLDCFTAAMWEAGATYE